MVFFIFVLFESIVVKFTNECTYKSKHENEWPHHSRNAMSFVFCFLCFRINTGKNCWNKTDKKTDNYSKTTEQL